MKKYFEKPRPKQFVGRNVPYEISNFFLLFYTMIAKSISCLIRRPVSSFILHALFCLFFVGSPPFNQALHAQNPQELFTTANNHYQNEDFQKAAEYYEQIIALGYISEAVYYNLGNCYFKLNEIGRAILNYERALKLDPNNEDILFNLKLANLRVADRIEPLPQMLVVAWIKNILSAFTSDGWAIGSTFFLWLTLAYVACFLFINRPSLRQFLFLSALFSFLFSIILFLIAWRQSNVEKNQRHGIVMVTNTYIKSAPAANATDLFILREGVKAEILDEANGWRKIRLADGKVGWIELSHIEII